MHSESARSLNRWLGRCEPFLTRLSAMMNLSLTLTQESGEVALQTDCSCCCAEAKGGKACAEEYARLSRVIVKAGESAAVPCGKGRELRGIPIAYRRNVVSMLFVCLGPGEQDKKAELTGVLEEMARLIGAQICDQIEVDNLVQEISVRYEELNLIYDTGRALGRVERINRTIERIITKTAETLDADLAMVSVPDKALLAVVSRNCTLPASYFDDESRKREVEGLILQKLASADTSPPYVLLNGNGGDPALAELRLAPLTVLAVPVTLNGEIDGFLTVFKLCKAGSFETGQVRLLASLGEQISILITNATLYEDLRGFLLNVVKAFVESIEAKDAYTRGHSERVNQISLAIGEAMGLSGEEKQVLNWASILHDIGKIGIPEALLVKPGKLTAEEYTVIKQHPEKGTRILVSIDQLRDATPGILHHHERFDGNGYPEGLKGSDIPLFARIIAVADTYDAMLSKRAYRAEISQEETLAEISRVSGSQLDPEIVAYFLETLEAGIQSPKALEPCGLERR